VIAKPSRPSADRDVTADLRAAAHAILGVVAALGAVLSYRSLQQAAGAVFPDPLSYGFPLLVDALVLGASLQYVAGCRDHSQGRHGWRAVAHAGIVATLALNALAADRPSQVPWHVTAPAVWAVLVELYARSAAGVWRAERDGTQTIPFRLWLTAPVESARTWLHLARVGSAARGRAEVGRHAAAAQAVRLTLPGRSGGGVRRFIRRQLRSGAVTPAVVLSACGWDGAGPVVARDPHEVLRAVVTPVQGGSRQVSTWSRGKTSARQEAPTETQVTPVHDPAVTHAPAPSAAQVAGSTLAPVAGPVDLDRWVALQRAAGSRRAEVLREGQAKFGVSESTVKRRWDAAGVGAASAELQASGS